MAYTLQQLEELERKIAAGAVAIRHGDKSVQLADLAELRKLREIIRRELGLVKPPRAGVATVSRGIR